MQTSIIVDDELLAKAQTLTNLYEQSLLIKEALAALIERESAKRLVNLVQTKRRLVSHKKLRDSIKPQGAPLSTVVVELRMEENN